MFAHTCMICHSQYWIGSTRRGASIGVMDICHGANLLKHLYSYTCMVIVLWKGCMFKQTVSYAKQIHRDMTSHVMLCPDPFL